MPPASTSPASCSTARTCSARDLRITNFGGGNTSAKVDGERPADRRAGDGAVGQGLGRRHRLDEARRLRDALSRQARGAEEPLSRPRRTKTRWSAICHHCTFNLNPRAASIDTPLHAFVPHRHVDHVHADAVIAIAASKNAEALTQEIFGGEIGFLPWQRPGFDLGLKLGAMAAANPESRRRRARRPWPVHLGRRRRRTATRRRCASSRRRPTGSPRNSDGAAPSAGRASQPCLRPSAPRSRRG